MNATRRTTHAFPSSAMSTAKAAAETARSTPEESGSSGRMSTTWIATATASAVSSRNAAGRALRALARAWAFAVEPRAYVCVVRESAPPYRPFRVRAEHVNRR
jgi:hypothetical protein